MRFRTSHAVPAVIALTVWCSSPQPTSAHEGRGQEEDILDTGVPPGNLLGPWMRNAELSEDPIPKLASVWPRPELVPRVLRQPTEGLDDRLATVLIKFNGDVLTLLDGRGEFRSFSPEEVGDRLRRRLRSASPYATLTDDGLRIERFIFGWTWTDDFTRQDDKLIRTIGIRGGSFRTLELRTVYDPVRDEHPSAAPATGPVNPWARAAAIRILPPEREYRELLSGSVEIRTLVTHPAIRTVEFLLDGAPAQRKRKRPFKARLARWLNRITPWGGTALSDGILFSLLQYESEPGRRAPVMVTDGADLHSRHFPIDPAPEDPPWTERIARAFDQIEEDLRHQHVLTYYSSQPQGAPIRPEVRVTRRGLKLRSAVPLEAIE